MICKRVTGCYISDFHLARRKRASFVNEGTHDKSFIFLQSFYIVLQPWGLVIAKTVSCKNMLSAKAVIPNIAFNCR